jgi:phosphopantothenoylcysteine decarboxylase / phosphopantothenate---cysteine ligase
VKLTNRKIVLGITGCIAAYKAAFLVRLLRKEGAEVRVVMTESSEKFITRLTMETLSGNPVSDQMFPESGFYTTHHISLAEWADLIIIAPATGNIIGKIASGVADDLLSTVIMAAQSPVMLAAAMNTEMYNNPIVQQNISSLKELGYMFVEPGVGELACDTVGVGRLAEPEDIVNRIFQHFKDSSDLSGLNVLVTAGPTVEHIDAVRYISNPSSGRMGYAIAQKAMLRGARVTLISGPVSLEAPNGANLINIVNGQQMLEETQKHFDKTDILFMVAAVSDYVPAESVDYKLKKSSEKITLAFNPQIDILSKLSENKSGQILIGFAMETDDEMDNAKAKLKNKNLDMIVLNKLNEEGAGFGVETNKVTFIEKDGNINKLPLMKKTELADKIIDYALKIKNRKD